MTISVKDAVAASAAAQADLEQAEQDLASGTKALSVKRYHEISDRARHRKLTELGERQKAESKAAAERLADLEQLGSEIDALAAGDGPARMTAALDDVARACERFRALAAEHDATVAELAATARECGAEAAAPGGPRKGSAFVAVKGTAVMHRGTIVRPVAAQALESLGRAMVGDVEGAAAMLGAVETARVHRPTHLLRAGNGSLHAWDELTEPMQGQIRSGDLTELSESDIDRWMAGELG